ncbi:MAG: sigma-70 family RNA polymerase sigma factor [Acidobacteriota bacterium]|jgi:RNA polymerase sigma-70 factor (ECF subfamily)
MDQPFELIFGTLMTFESEAMRLSSGDTEVIAQLVERYQHRLYRYLLRLVSRPSTAEDLFQQTWMRVIERMRHYDPRRSFEGWLFAVAHNLAIDHLRRRQPESLDEPLPSGETQSDLTRSSNPGALELLLSKERAGCVLNAVSELPLAFREVITLRFEEEMKLEEIATVLALPMGTVKTRLHRAMKALRLILSRKMQNGTMP